MTSIRNLLRKRYPGCTDSICRPDMQHRPCSVCFEITDSKQVVIADTGKRTQQFFCDRHSQEAKNGPRQDRLRAARTSRDWSEVTTPINTKTIRPDRMPEQFAGRTRAALRAFVASGASRAEVPDIDPGTLNASINNLGLTDSVYAETRDGTTVLRRIQAAKKSRVS